MASSPPLRRSTHPMRNLLGIRTPREAAKSSSGYELFLQRQRRGWGADLRAVDHEDVGVATRRPFRCFRCEAVERGRIIAGRHVLAHLLEAGVSEVRRVSLDQRIIVGVFVDDRDVASLAKV